MRDDGMTHGRRLKVLTAFVLMGAVMLLPFERMEIAEGFEPNKLRMGLGIFVCIAFLWMTEALPLTVTALLVPVLATLMGTSGVKTALAPFADPLIAVFFGGFALAAAMSRQGVDKWIAMSFVRMGKGGFLKVSVLLFCGTAFLSMWMSNTATAAMMIPLALGILSRIEGGGDGCRRFLLLGLAYSASIGGLGTVIGSPPNGIAAGKLGLNFTEWMAFGIPTVLVLLPAMIVILWLLCRPESSGRLEVRTEPFEWNIHRRMMVVIFALAAGCWIFSGPLTRWLDVDGPLDSLVALSVIVLLILTRVADWRDIDRGTDWGVLLLFGGGLALSGVLKDTEASGFLAHLLEMATADWPLVAVVAATVGFVIFLTEVSSNTAVAALCVPVFYSLAVDSGHEPAKLVMPLALAASCAFMMPVATPPNALVYGTGLVSQAAMMKTGIWLNLICIVLLTALSVVLF